MSKKFGRIFKKQRITGGERVIMSYSTFLNNMHYNFESILFMKPNKIIIFYLLVLLSVSHSCLQAWLLRV